MDEPGGLLLAMMQPPPTIEEEFQDWYDTEHFPERANCEGFVTAQRLVCVDGFPRYLALYDLSNRAVLDGPGYAAIARNRYSPWTQRIIPRMWGHYRAEADQVYPGRARLGDQGVPTRLAVWRFTGISADTLTMVVDSIRACLSKTPNLLQIRVFDAKGSESGDVIALIELTGPASIPSPKPDMLGPLIRHINLSNVYVPYWR